MSSILEKCQVIEDGISQLGINPTTCRGKNEHQQGEAAYSRHRRVFPSSHPHAGAASTEIPRLFRQDPILYMDTKFWRPSQI